jgi:CrcB protein
MIALWRSLIVFTGAGLGATARYWMGVWMLQKLGPGFPWWTFTINLSGSFLIGVAGGVWMTQPASHPWRLFVIVGILGGYTTFSSFSLETFNLMREKSYLYAGFNVVGSCLFGLVACWLGLVLASALFKG